MTDALRVYRVSIEVSDGVCIMEDIEDVLDHLDAECAESQAFAKNKEPFDREAARQTLEAAPVGGHLEFAFTSTIAGIPDLTYVEVAEMTRADYDALPEFDGW